MATWTMRSDQRAQGVDARLIRVMKEVWKRWPGELVITEGLRTRDRQAQLVREGKSKTMNSRHIVGKAVDVAVIENGKAVWTVRAYTELARCVCQVANEMDVPIRWGGSWRHLSGPQAHDYPFVGAKFFDGPHFEIPEGY